MKDYDDFFEGKAVQTDGSSVVLMDIATLNDARVDMVADAGVNWYVDYNEENLYTNGRPVERSAFRASFCITANSLIPVPF